MACPYRNEYGTNEGSLMFSEASYMCLLFGCLICNNMTVCLHMWQCFYILNVTYKECVNKLYTTTTIIIYLVMHKNT